MEPLLIRKLPSPDRRFEVRLEPSDGNPWQITYASLSLSDMLLGQRIFGYRGLWSDCSRYFVIPEWRHADFSIIPDMHLLVIDAAEMKECVIARAKNGFIEPTRVQNGTIRYNMFMQGMRERIGLERKLSALTAWRPVSDSLPDADDVLDQ